MASADSGMDDFDKNDIFGRIGNSWSEFAYDLQQSLTVRNKMEKYFDEHFISHTLRIQIGYNEQCKRCVIRIVSPHLCQLKLQRREKQFTEQSKTFA